jgi:hypothetical protein
VSELVSAVNAQTQAPPPSPSSPTGTLKTSFNPRATEVRHTVPLYSHRIHPSGRLLWVVECESHDSLLHGDGDGDDDIDDGRRDAHEESEDDIDSLRTMIRQVFLRADHLGSSKSSIFDEAPSPVDDDAGPPLKAALAELSPKATVVAPVAEADQAKHEAADPPKQEAGAEGGEEKKPI